jgi:hypothetical protein
VPSLPLQKNYGDLNLSQRLDVLCNQMGWWYHYAPLIAALNWDGFTPSSIEEATVISDVQ